MDSLSIQYKAELLARLRSVIRHRCHSVAALERKLGRQRGYIGDALRGTKQLTVDLLLEILECLHLDPYAFFAGRNEVDGPS